MTNSLNGDHRKMATGNMKAMWALLLTVTVVTAVAPSAAAGQFKKPVYYQLNDTLDRVISADFTNDGNLDLTVAGFFSGQVAVLLGRGNGTFHSAQYFSAPGAFALAAGDFNGDHNLDLAVVEYGGTGNSALGIFLGDGKGNFRESATYTLGIESYSVAVADFDGDGHLDVAVANGFGYGKQGQDGSLMVFLGRGDGTFKSPANYKLPNRPCAVATGDLNGDHYPDIVVAECNSDSAAVLMNDGHGKFKRTHTYGVGAGPNDVVIQDLGNGTLDLVLSDPAGGSVAVLLGNGDGTFGKATLYSTLPLGAGNPFLVVVGDFNRDGNPDIAVAIANGKSGIAILYGDGDGTFQSPIFVAHPTGALAGLALGDFNKDGAPDLAVSAAAPNHVAVLINTQ